MHALDAIEKRSEAITTGINRLNEMAYEDEEDPERTEALLETIRPGIEAIQPI